VQGGLVDDVAVEDRLDRLDVGFQPLERRRQLVADTAPDVDLVTCRRLVAPLR
jgi:hypothetical protein